MVPLFNMPSGAEWLIVLAIVILLFGSTKLPALVRQLGKSKKIWEEEVGPRKKDPELSQETSTPPAQAPVQQQAAPQAQAQPNGQAPGDGLPPTHTAN